MSSDSSTHVFVIGYFNNLVTPNLVILETFKFVKHLLVEFLPKEQDLKSAQ